MNVEEFLEKVKTGIVGKLGGGVIVYHDEGGFIYRIEWRKRIENNEIITLRRAVSIVEIKSMITPVKIVVDGFVIAHDKAYPGDKHAR